MTEVITAPPPDQAPPTGSAPPTPAATPEATEATSPAPNKKQRERRPTTGDVQTKYLF